MVDANNIAANRPEETQETVKKQGYFGPNLVFLFFSIFFVAFRSHIVVKLGKHIYCKVTLPLEKRENTKNHSCLTPQ